MATTRRAVGSSAERGCCSTAASTGMVANYQLSSVFGHLPASELAASSLLTCTAVASVRHGSFDSLICQCISKCKLSTDFERAFCSARQCQCPDECLSYQRSNRTRTQMSPTEASSQSCLQAAAKQTAIKHRHTPVRAHWLQIGPLCRWAESRSVHRGRQMHSIFDRTCLG